MDVGWEDQNDYRHSFLRLGFNPCFGGCRLGSQFLDADKTKHGTFQSLFWWMSVGKYDRSSITDIQDASFNPCFGGCRLGRMLRYLLIILNLVSILVLVDVGWEVVII